MHHYVSSRAVHTATIIFGLSICIVIYNAHITHVYTELETCLSFIKDVTYLT